jgi:hypothetical protein
LKTSITSLTPIVGLLIAQTSLASDLRPLAADRPDATESPQTVDAGHWQIETSVVGFSRDRQNGQTTEKLQILNTNLKYGLTDAIDLHLVFTPWIEQTQGSEKNQSHGDIELRSKINLIGNDGGEYAVALLPYIKLPSGDLSNDKTEGGMIATYGSSIGNYGVGAQIKLDYLYDETQDKMVWIPGYSAVLGYEITSDVNGYIEHIGDFDTENQFLPYASFGFTFQTSANRQWDIGSKVALNDEAEDFEIFFGLTQRY